MCQISLREFELPFKSFKSYLLCGTGINAPVGKWKNP